MKRSVSNSLKMTFDYFDNSFFEDIEHFRKKFNDRVLNK